tara:strand:- start:364 stop:1092 length:729 start_codon:yes stop_codon:yes gene_type:complete
MFLAIDIGNSNISCGIYNNNEWQKIFRIPTNKNFQGQLIQLKKYNIQDVAISSVVPELTNLFLNTIKAELNIDPFIITYQNTNLSLNVDSPEEVGSDRICNGIAAIALVGHPAIIGDIGSATNYDVIDENGTFIGGSIAPGLETAAKHLFKKAALLKEIAFTIPKKTIGKNTTTNLQSGIMFGAIDVIDGMLNRIISETGWNKSYNIITGGFGELISPHLKTKHKLIPTLTLDGIRIIYYKQ